MSDNVVAYSMYKPAGYGWVGNGTAMLHIFVSGGEDKPLTISITDGEITLKKIYFTKTGEVYDNFMWLASMEKIHYTPMISAGFYRCDEL